MLILFKITVKKCRDKNDYASVRDPCANGGACVSMLTFIVYSF
jgi:hypothetical protein